MFKRSVLSGENIIIVMLMVHRYNPRLGKSENHLHKFRISNIYVNKFGNNIDF